MCVTLLEGLTQKYMKGDVSICDSLKKKVSQRGLGSQRPHGTRAGLMTWLLAIEWTTSLLHSNWWCCLLCALLSSLLFLSKVTLCGFRKNLHINDLCSIMTIYCHFYISNLTPITYNMHMCTKITRMPVNEAHTQFTSSAVRIMSMNINKKMKQHWPCSYNKAVNLKVGVGSKSWKVLMAYKYTVTL